MGTSFPNQCGVSVLVSGLHKSFNGQEVLQGLDFEVRSGEIFVIMGPSGSGKTVLLKHLIGLLKSRTPAKSLSTGSTSYRLRS